MKGKEEIEMAKKDDDEKEVLEMREREGTETLKI
jgi:hypothetical protein